MHDYLQIIGLARGASPHEVRLATARRRRRMHPDFGTAAAGPAADLTLGDDRLDPDRSMNFVDMAQVVARMQAAFFTSGS